MPGALAPWQCGRDHPEPHRERSKHFYTNYQLANSAVSLRSNISPYIRPPRVEHDNTYRNVRSESQDGMARGLQPRFPAMATRPESAPREHRSSKKLYICTPPSVQYRQQKRERLLALSGQVQGAEHRWEWDTTKVPEPIDDRHRSEPALSATHPNSIGSILTNWRRRLDESRMNERVHYHRKDVFGRQAFIDGTTEMQTILYDYPDDMLIPEAAPDTDYKPQ